MVRRRIGVITAVLVGVTVIVSGVGGHPSVRERISLVAVGAFVVAVAIHQEGLARRARGYSRAESITAGVVFALIGSAFITGGLLRIGVQPFLSIVEITAGAICASWGVVVAAVERRPR